MSRIRETFQSLTAGGEGALIGYLTFGDPDIITSTKLLKCLAKNVDVLEIGIPFSDPIADGPTIQAAMERALKNGVTTENVFEAVIELRQNGVRKPFVLMTYYNIILQYGRKTFLKRCRETGVDGVLVSDLPIEESEEFVEQCSVYDVDPIFLIAPTTPVERAKRIIEKGKGFIYLVSLLGVTGERENVEKRTLQAVTDNLKLTCSLPMVVGFGISKAEHVKAIIEAGASGVVVGSVFVSLVARYGAGACKEIEKLSEELKEGTK